MRVEGRRCDLEESLSTRLAGLRVVDVEGSQVTLLHASLSDLLGWCVGSCRSSLFDV